MTWGFPSRSQILPRTPGWWPPSARQVPDPWELDDADVALHGSTVLSLAESLDDLLGFTYDGHVVFLASHRGSGARDVITAVIEPSAYDSLLVASRAYSASLEAATWPARPAGPGPR